MYIEYDSLRDGELRRFEIEIPIVNVGRYQLHEVTVEFPTEFMDDAKIQDEGVDSTFGLGVNEREGNMTWMMIVVLIGCLWFVFCRRICMML